MTTHSHDALLTIKELAAALGRHRTYITAMKEDGFVMPGGLATIREAREHLAKHANPRRRAKYAPKQGLGVGG